MIAIYSRIDNTALKKQAKTTTEKIETWFVNNPKRRVCKAQLWYGRMTTIKRNNVKEQIDAIVNKLIAENR